MRLNQSEKFEIIRLVEQSPTSVNKTLKELGLHKSTFYAWYNAYHANGYDGLAHKPPIKKQYWNQIPDEERQLVINLALEQPEMSSREIACLFTDTYKRFVSESSVYRILKERGLIQKPAFELIKAANEYHTKTVKVNEMWQTDFTYFKIYGRGWYYLSTVLDDYSRFIIHWRLCETMKSDDAEQTIQEALIKSNLKANQRPKLLSDNGSSYIASDFKEYLDKEDIKHIRGRARHPQTQGKIERYHLSMKCVVKQVVYYSPEELIFALQEFVHYYNYVRYHESLNNTKPADMYYGRANRIIERRKKIKEKTLRNRKIEYYSRMPLSKNYSDANSGPKNVRKICKSEINFTTILNQLSAFK